MIMKGASTRTVRPLQRRMYRDWYRPAFLRAPVRIMSINIVVIHRIRPTKVMNRKNTLAIRPTAMIVVVFDIIRLIAEGSSSKLGTSPSSFLARLT